MARMVQCIKLNKEAEGLDFPPYPGELGKKIYENVSKEAWEAWVRLQTMLVNEYRLNLADPKAREYLKNRWKTTFSEKAPIRLKDTLRRRSKELPVCRKFTLLLKRSS